MNILILGATGLVGNDALAILKNQEEVKSIICPTRRPLESHPKLINPDFNNWLKDIQENINLLVNIDAVICCLGTTIKLAKSKENFKYIDHELVLQVADLCKKADIKTFAYNSSIGANADSNQLYTQVKGLVEKDLENLKFKTLCIVRPSLLVGKKRTVFRLGEFIGIQLTKLINPILPKKYRSIKTKKVAKALCTYATKPDLISANKIILESDRLQNY